MKMSDPNKVHNMDTLGMSQILDHLAYRYTDALDRVYAEKDPNAFTSYVPYPKGGGHILEQVISVCHSVCKPARLLWHLLCTHIASVSLQLFIPKIDHCRAIIPMRQIRALSQCVIGQERPSSLWILVAELCCIMQFLSILSLGIVFVLGVLSMLLKKSIKTMHGATARVSSWVGSSSSEVGNQASFLRKVYLFKPIFHPRVEYKM